MISWLVSVDTHTAVVACDKFLFAFEFVNGAWLGTHHVVSPADAEAVRQHLSLVRESAS